MITIIQPTLHDLEAVIAEFRQTWESGQVTTGTFTRRFESAVEEKLGVPHAVMVQSCTAGMMLVLRAFDLKGEVILPAFTWTSTAHAVVWNGLTPVFADISPGDYTLDPESVKNLVTPRTVAVMPVNVFGLPPDYDAFAQLGRDCQFRLVYDSAQGLGSRYLSKNGGWHYSGVFGDAEIFSMSPTKVVSAIEGGLITTHNFELASQLRQMRDYGKTADGENIAWLGLSARVPEINAIVARHNFYHMDRMVARRRELRAAYLEGLSPLLGIHFQEIPESRESSCNYFTIFLGRKSKVSRNEAYMLLKERGIQAKKYFHPALHLQDVHLRAGHRYQGKLPVTEKAAAQGLALPFYSHMTLDIVNRVIEALNEILQ